MKKEILVDEKQDCAAFMFRFGYFRASLRIRDNYIVSAEGTNPGGIISVAGTPAFAFRAHFPFAFLLYHIVVMRTVTYGKIANVFL